MKPAFKNTQNTTHTTRNMAALLVILYSTFLMSLVTVAGTRDTVSKKDSCCSTCAATKAVSTTTVKSTTPVETPSNTTDPNAAPEAMKMSAAAFQVQVSSSDDDLNNHFASSNFQASANAHVATCDALTDVQAQREALVSSFPKGNAQFVAADSKIDQSFRASFNLDTPFAAESATKLLIHSDKNLTQHFNQQYGMEVASVK